MKMRIKECGDLFQGKLFNFNTITVYDYRYTLSDELITTGIVVFTCVRLYFTNVLYQCPGSW